MAEEAEANRTWCARADDAAASTAWTPASGTAGDTSVGVLSGDPRHSAAIRDAITAGLRSGTIAARHHRRRLAGVALVGGGPGDPGLITVRGRQLLAEADVVIADRLGPRELLAELPPDVTVIDAGKVPYRGRCRRTRSTRRSSRTRRAGSSWSGSRAVTRSSSAAAARRCSPACGPACR